MYQPSYHFRKACEEGKAIFSLLYPLKKLPFRFDVYREVYIADLLTSVLNEQTFNYFRINKNLCYSCSAYVGKGDDWLTHDFSIPCGEENLQKIIDLYPDYIKSLPAELPREAFEKHRERKITSYDFDFVVLDSIANSCIAFYEKRNKLYNTKLKLENRKLGESITYEEVNEMYKSLFKVKPHITIVSNDEKYKEYKYEDFKVTKN